MLDRAQFVAGHSTTVAMHSERSAGANNGGGDGVALRSSDRLRRRPMVYGRTFYYYNSPGIIRPKRRNSGSRTTAADIAKMLRPGSRSLRRRKPNLNSNAVNGEHSSLRSSTRKKRSHVKIESHSDSSDTDEGTMRTTRSRTRSQTDNTGSQNDRDSSSTKRGKIVDNRPAPGREGLRPRLSKIDAIARIDLTFHQEKSSSEEKVEEDENESNDGDSNNVDENDTDDGEDDEDRQGEEEDDDDGEGEGDDDEDEREEDSDDEEAEEEQDGHRRYDLRNRAEVGRLPLEETKERQRSPCRVISQGMGAKINMDARKGGSRVRKRHRIARDEDSDDSLLVDESDLELAGPWVRSGTKSGPPWPLGGLDVHGITTWGLNLGASGWVHQSDSSSFTQTAGPSSKGGADIQPVQVDEDVSFEDIGGLSQYIDALKEMVFFPLLYPEFFASYNITPPRGVLLCGPPGTGKTLIARALACAASKAGQKVSFYMRKGADVLSKWVGEAERQLKLLFEEAQRNQPSIIFFDEIDGLAPVRSSKQEQIHNSIVSTLLALMDGLDSRGQVVLIGATNRIDAIDGALRRPGRFDREFTLPLPGYEARVEIINIHTRKWKHPPSEELTREIAAGCVGYCGADLKALCTESAIRAFRENYPQVYTSDDKYVIDVDSVRVQRSHFVDSMSTITPAAHRGSIVHSRPLSSALAPCLQSHLKKIMEHVADIFPVISDAPELTKLSMLSYGSPIFLIYRPRLLLCGNEGVGLDHLGPAVLHELEKFPVHFLGLPSLLSDPGAKTPEEALIHIFGEARGTTPSILYLPQFDLWWSNAHEQLRAVLTTLLEELPSHSPILLLGTSSSSDVVADGLSSIFPRRSVYEVGKPSAEDRSLFFDSLIEAALSVGRCTKSQETTKPAELPKAPKLACGPKASELKSKIEAEQHALRRLRMCLRDICNRMLYDKRFRAFHLPLTDEDDPNYRKIVQNPMDLATLLQHVDSGQYTTCSSFLQSVDLILANAKAYNGDDYNGARIVSRAYELRDAVRGMLAQMDPSLVLFCDDIAAQGGPTQLSDGFEASAFPLPPVVQLATPAGASSMIRNIQPDVNLDQSRGTLKRMEKNVDSAHEEEIPELHKTKKPIRKSQTGSDDGSPINLNQPSATAESPIQVEDATTDGETSGKIESTKQRFLDHTGGYGVPQLERLYARVMKGVFEARSLQHASGSKSSIIRFLAGFSMDPSNF